MVIQSARFFFQDLIQLSRFCGHVLVCFNILFYGRYNCEGVQLIKPMLKGGRWPSPVLQYSAVGLMVGERINEASVTELITPPFDRDCNKQGFVCTWTFALRPRLSAVPVTTQTRWAGERVCVWILAGNYNGVRNVWKHSNQFSLRS